MDQRGTSAAEIFDELRRNFFKEARRDAGLGHVGAVAAAVVGAGEDERVHGARHADVAEAALFFKFFGAGERARVREEALFKAGEKDQREFEALGGVERHERDAGVGVELVGVGGESGVVEEFGEGFAALLGVVRGVGEFLQVLNAAEGLGRAFGFESFDVAGAVDDEADELGEGGGVAGRAEGLRAVLVLVGFVAVGASFPGPKFETWGTRFSGSDRDMTSERPRLRLWSLPAGEKCDASRSGIWFSSPPNCASTLSISGVAGSRCRAEAEAGVGVVGADSATSAASLPAKSGSIMACASRMSWRKDSSAMSARVGMRRLAMAAAVASHVERPVSRARRSRVSSVVLPMPRAGVLMTRCRAMESCGLRTRRR